MSGINIKDLERGKTSFKEASVQPQHDIQTRIKNILDREIVLFSKKFSDKHKESFYLELATLLSSGLDLKATLEIIEAEQDVPRHAAFIGKIKDDLIQGRSLWEAMQLSGEFTPYEYYSVQIGEETGKLVIVLDQLYRFYTERLKQKQQLVSALSYPVIILITSIGAVTFMLLFIVPMFRDVFKRFGGDLPYLTQVIISISEFIQGYFLLWFMLFTATSIYLFVNRKKPWFHFWTVRFIKKIPVVGNVVYSLQLARFCTSMSLLLGSKVPLIRSLQLINQMIVFFPIQHTLSKMEDDIMHGEMLHVSMARFSIYNKKMVSLIKVGEEVNKLDLFFEKLAKQYSSDAEHQTSLLNTFLEPAMIIFLGFVVGFILLAMYLPMFQMATNIGG